MLEANICDMRMSVLPIIIRHALSRSASPSFFCKRQRCRSISTPVVYRKTKEMLIDRHRLLCSRTTNLGIQHLQLHISSNALGFSSRKHEFLSAGFRYKDPSISLYIVYKKCPEAVLGNTERKKSLRQPRKPTQNCPFHYILR